METVQYYNLSIFSNKIECLDFEEAKTEFRNILDQNIGLYLPEVDEDEVDEDAYMRFFGILDNDKNICEKLLTEMAHKLGMPSNLWIEFWDGYPFLNGNIDDFLENCDD